LLSPADIVIDPPFVVTVLPTHSKISPPLPPVAKPVANVTLPLAPALDVPDDIVIEPLTPADPAFGVATTNDPLDFADPYPVLIEMSPP
jgi:hypothetical protein